MLSRRGQWQTRESEHSAGETAASGSQGREARPYRAGDGAVPLHDALCFLVARADFAVRAESPCLALAAGDLIPNKARFTSSALVGSL